MVASETGFEKPCNGHTKLGLKKPTKLLSETL